MKWNEMKSRKSVCWLCSSCPDEENAPVAATVHRGGSTFLWRPSATQRPPMSFFFFLFFPCCLAWSANYQILTRVCDSACLSGPQGDAVVPPSLCQSLWPLLTAAAQKGGEGMSHVPGLASGTERDIAMSQQRRNKLNVIVNVIVNETNMWDCGTKLPKLPDSPS